MYKVIHYVNVRDIRDEYFIQVRDTENELPCIFLIAPTRAREKERGRAVADRIVSPASLSLIAHRSGGKIAKGTGYRCCPQGWMAVENTGGGEWAATLRRTNGYSRFANESGRKAALSFEGRGRRKYSRIFAGFVARGKSRTLSVHFRLNWRYLRVNSAPPGDKPLIFRS